MPENGSRVDALRQSELRYRTLVEATSAVTWSCPPSGLHVEPQPMWMSFTGQTADEMLGAGWGKAVHPDDIAAASQSWAEAVARGEPYHSEHRIRRNDGVWRWMSTLAVPIRDANGKIAEWFGMNFDITERKEAEESLRQTRDMFAEAEKIAHLGSFQYVIATGMTVWSEEEYRIYGLDPTAPSPTYDEMLARCIHADDAAVLHESFTKAMDHRRVFELTHRIVRPDGTVRWVHDRAHPYFDRKGRLLRYIGATLDITDRRAMEVTIAQERERFQMALEAAPIAIVMIDGSGTILMANPTLQNVFGYTADELLGRKIEMLIPVRLRERHVQLRQGFLAAPTVRRMGIGQRLTARRKDNSEFPVEVGLSHFVLGDAALTVATISDVSDHEAAVARQEQARLAAEAASETKSRFLANVSHELRTPLNAVLGINEVLRLGGVSETQAQLLDKQQSAGHHLLQVLNAILDLSKVDAGRYDLVERRFRLDDLVRQVMDMAQGSASAKGLEISVSVAPNLPAFLGDDTKLQQALLNYLSNAVKFTDAGRIAVRVLPVDDGDLDVLLRFEVEDSGVGIEADVLHRLFAPFEQADSSSTRRFGGIGLGLAITRHIAEMMGGVVAAQSTPNRGSTFWFTARVKKARLDEAPAAIAASPSAILRRRHAGRQILLAEDDPVSSEIAQLILGKAGLSVTPATTGTEAVRLAAARAFDLILMDLTMPEMDGLEATRRIRQGPHGAEVPVVALTANAFAEDRAKCLAAGMVDLVSKPVDATCLCSAVLKWLEAGGTAEPPRDSAQDGS